MSLSSRIALIGTIVAGATVTSCRFEVDQFWYKNDLDGTYVQVDRVGIPFLSELFLNTDVRHLMSTTDPTQDLSALKDAMVTEIKEIRAMADGVVGFPVVSVTALSPEGTADFLLPNVLTIDLGRDIDSSTDNGFSLQDDDAFDQYLSLLFGRTPLSDGVSEESDAAERAFPYLDRQNY